MNNYQGEGSQSQREGERGSQDIARGSFLLREKGSQGAGLTRGVHRGPFTEGFTKKDSQREEFTRKFSYHFLSAYLDSIV